MLKLKLSKIEKTVLCLSIAFAAYISFPVTASAMHIMEGYLPIGHSLIWGAVCVPFVVWGVMRLRRTVEENRRALILLAMSGAFIFVISAIKIPSVTGSSSHMTGTGLSAILFGVGVTSILAIIVLIFQAILIAHGGLTTLGANTFSMGIAGPALTILLYKCGRKMKMSRTAAVFIAVSLGDLFAYCVTAIQLAMAHPGASGGVAESAVLFLAVFAPTQVPLAVVEGLLTVLIITGMEHFAPKELSDIKFMEAG